MEIETKNFTYYCWAEHTQGKNVAHCCRSGSYCDPSENWEAEVEAKNQDEANTKAQNLFDKYVEGWEGETDDKCACGKYQGLMNSWHDSVSVIVSRKPYPDHADDDEV